MKRIVQLILAAGLLLPLIVLRANPLFVLAGSPPAAGGGSSLEWTHLDGTSTLHTSEPITTGTINAAAGSRVFVSFAYSVVGGGTAGVNDTVTVTGGGVTWDLVSEHYWAARRGIHLFVSDGTPSSATLSIDFTTAYGSTFQEAAYSVDEATCNTTTRYSGLNTNTGASGTTVQVDLTGGTVDSGDHTFFVAAHETAETITAEAGFTQLFTFLGSAGLRSIIVAYDGTPTIDQTPSASWSSSSGSGIIGIIVEAP